MSVEEEVRGTELRGILKEVVVGLEFGKETFEVGLGESGREGEEADQFETTDEVTADLISQSGQGCLGDDQGVAKDGQWLLGLVKDTDDLKEEDVVETTLMIKRDQ